MNKKIRYTATDLAVIVPTKNRPQKMLQLLNTLLRQTKQCGKIIIVASGESIREVIDKFSNTLQIEYYETKLSGQIKQRNMGIQYLDSSTKLVATLDDDIELKSDAIEKMIDFWNQCATEVAGVGFNVFNEKSHKHSWLRGFIGISTKQPGRVLPSGWVTSLCNVSCSIKTQWLNGGATVWKQEILQTYQHNEIKSRWAICEDLIFSYPIGKKHQFYICADAKVSHNHVMDQNVTENIYRYRARSVMLWILYFVNDNPELSKFAYFWSWFFVCFGYGLRILFSKQKKQQFNLFIGQIEGGLIGIRALVQGKDLQSVLENQN